MISDNNRIRISDNDQQRLSSNDIFVHLKYNKYKNIPNYINLIGLSSLIK